MVSRHSSAARRRPEKPSANRADRREAGLQRPFDRRVLGGTAQRRKRDQIFDRRVGAGRGLDTSVPRVDQAEAEAGTNGGGDDHRVVPAQMALEQLRPGGQIAAQPP